MMGKLLRRASLRVRPAARGFSSKVTRKASSKGDVRVAHAWYAALRAAGNKKLSPPNLATICRAARVAAGLPSTAKGTPVKEGCAPATNVISGWTDATAMAALRRGSSSRLSKAPLEWNAKRTLLLTLVGGFPFLPAAARAARLTANAEAAPRISRSGTQNHSNVASSAAERAVTDSAPTIAAIVRACLRDRGESRATISASVKRASFSATGRKVARLPAPITATEGFLVLVIGIVLRVIGIVLRQLVFGSTAQHTLYCCHGEIGRNEVSGDEVNASPRSIFPHQLPVPGVHRHVR